MAALDDLGARRLSVECPGLVSKGAQVIPGIKDTASREPSNRWSNLYAQVV